MNAEIKLYDSTGINVIYTFPLVQDTNIHEGAGRKSISHTGPRGKGAIVIDGGEEAYEAAVQGIIFENDYDAVIAAIEAMKTAIQPNTAYVLKMRKTVSTSYEENVKRIKAITFPVDTNTKMTKMQNYTVTFLANSW